MDHQPVDVVRAFLAGTIAWAVAFVALLPFAGTLADHDRSWWLWASLAGVGIGLLGWELARWRRRRSSR
ncbi:MAG: DUF2530 domain-containing protein [Nocardioides sp.]|uniref:DUF2530 domain-containing protein n=1 Tax=Nocardioides sp. TaxID=35761 RepID=UPI0039E366D4